MNGAGKQTPGETNGRVRVLPTSPTSSLQLQIGIGNYFACSLKSIQL